MTDSDNSPDAALDALLPSAERTGDATADYTEAVRRALRRRDENAAHLGAVIRGLHELGLSWREIEARTGVKVKTARRWAGASAE